jgi:hypothetical protein
MIRKFLLLWFAALLYFPLQAQDISYAKQIIDTLCSPSMHGRGYVNNGDRIAAEYIRNEFIKDSLKFFSGYFQTFKLPVGTLPGKVDVAIDKTILTPGVDYLVSAGSPTTAGTYKIMRIDSMMVSTESALKKLIATDFSKKFILLDRKGVKNKIVLEVFKSIEDQNSLKAKGIIVIEDKLVWEAAEALNISTAAKVTVKRSSLSTVAKKITVNIEQQMQTAHEFSNVIGYVEGKTKPDSFVVFTAHYDHLGQMGAGTYFPGANDNASGTSMVLNLAKYYAAHKPDYSIVFMTFTGEELGLIGSDYYVHHPLFPLSKIRFLINLDMVGTGDDGIKVVNGAILEKEFKMLSNINDEKKYLPSVNKRGEAAISDHYPFYAKGVKSFFIYTLGGIGAYHNIYDKASTLPLTKYNELFKLLTDFVTALNVNK